MKHISISVLVLTLGGASIQAQSIQVQMTFSGTGVILAPAISLAAGAGPTNDVSAAGDGSLGPFTLRELSATAAMPSGPGCSGSNSLAFAFVAAAGIFRFQDGSLLTYKMKTGTQCIDFTKGAASVTFTDQITGGTGRFQNATGTISSTVPLSYPVIFDATGQTPALVAIANGTVTGTITTSPPSGGATGVTIVVTGSDGSTAANNTFQTVANQITLDASKSTSTNAGGLTYSWMLSPGFTPAAILSGNTSTPSFQFPTSGTYQFTLKVTDATGATATSTITVQYV